MRVSFKDMCVESPSMVSRDGDDIVMHVKSLNQVDTYKADKIIRYEEEYDVKLIYVPFKDLIMIRP